jgi:hypothetical protein
MVPGNNSLLGLQISQIVWLKIFLSVLTATRAILNAAQNMLEVELRGGMVEDDDSESYYAYRDRPHDHLICLIQRMCKPTRCCLFLPQMQSLQLVQGSYGACLTIQVKYQTLCNTVNVNLTETLQTLPPTQRVSVKKIWRSRSGEKRPVVGARVAFVGTFIIPILCSLMNQSGVFTAGLKGIPQLRPKNMDS